VQVSGKGIPLFGTNQLYSQGLRDSSINFVDEEQIQFHLVLAVSDFLAGSSWITNCPMLDKQLRQVSGYGGGQSKVVPLR